MLKDKEFLAKWEPHVGYFEPCGDPDCLEHRAASERLESFLRANPALMPIRSYPKGGPCLRQVANIRSWPCSWGLLRGKTRCEICDGKLHLFDHNDLFRIKGGDGVLRLVIISHPYWDGNKVEEPIWQPADKPDVRVRVGFRPEQFSWRNHGAGVGYAVADGEELNFDYLPPATEKTGPTCAVEKLRARDREEARRRRRLEG